MMNYLSILEVYFVLNMIYILFKNGETTMRFGIIFLLGTACINLEQLDDAINKTDSAEPIDLNLSVEIVPETTDVSEDSETAFYSDSILTCVVKNNDEELSFDNDSESVYILKYITII